MKKTASQIADEVLMKVGADPFKLNAAHNDAMSRLNSMAAKSSRSKPVPAPKPAKPAPALKPAPAPKAAPAPKTAPASTMQKAPVRDVAPLQQKSRVQIGRIEGVPGTKPGGKYRELTPQERTNFNKQQSSDLDPLQQRHMTEKFGPNHGTSKKMFETMYGDFENNREGWRRAYGMPKGK